MSDLDQTTFGAGKGNCFQACVASCLGLPLEEVPNFCVDYGDSDWWRELEKWCAERGLAPLTWTFDLGNQTNAVERINSFYCNPIVPLIVSGENAVGVAHSCVLRGDKLHDPNPSRAGLKTYRDAIAFVALNPVDWKAP